MDKNIKGNIGKALMNVVIIILGNLIYAAGVVFFILPSGLITGGTTGIALIADHLWGIPVSAFVGIFNVIMFILGGLILGRKFAMSTLISTVAYPVLLGMLQRAAGDFVLTDDMLISAIFGGICIGVSLALIIRRGASTGGMDIPPLVLNRFFRIPVSASMYVFDFIILAGQMAFSEKQASLYGILLVMVYTLTLDKLISLGSAKTKVEIISRSHEAIRERIINELDRSITLLHGQTGYLGIETDVLYCIIDPRELHRFEKIVHETDPEAFMVLTKASSVEGRGFSLNKNYIRQAQ